VFSRVCNSFFLQCFSIYIRYRHETLNFVTVDLRRRNGKSRKEREFSRDTFLDLSWQKATLGIEGNFSLLRSYSLSCRVPAKVKHRKYRVGRRSQWMVKPPPSGLTQTEKAVIIKRTWRRHKHHITSCVLSWLKYSISAFWWMIKYVRLLHVHVANIAWAILRQFEEKQNTSKNGQKNMK